MGLSGKGNSQNSCKQCTFFLSLPRASRLDAHKCGIVQFAACTLPVYQAFFLATKSQSTSPPPPKKPKSQSLDAPAHVRAAVSRVLSLVVGPLPGKPPRIAVLVSRLRISVTGLHCPQRSLWLLMLGIVAESGSPRGQSGQCP